jgi:Myb-like DNA-binding domain
MHLCLIFLFHVFHQEDEKIIELVDKYGPTKWSVIAKQLPGRIGKQCRERYKSYFILVKPLYGENCCFIVKC